MQENDDTQSKLSELQAPPEEKVHSKQGSLSVIFNFLNLFLIILLSLAGIFFFQKFRYIQVQQIESQQKIKQLAADAIVGDDQLKSQLQNLNLLHDELSALQKSYELQQESLSKLKERTDPEQIDWRLAEVDYLIRLAQYNLKVNTRIDLATTLLENAEEILQKAHDSRVTPLLEKIIHSVTLLQAVSPIDDDKLMGKLTILRDQVSLLKLKLPFVPAYQKSDLTSAHGWKEKLKASWKKIEELIIIRRHDKPIEPLLSVTDQIYLTENLQLLLQEAQWGLIQHNAILYHNSLREVQELVQKYFDVSDQLASNFSQQVQNLQEINVAPTLPDLNDLIQLTQTIRTKINAEKF